MRKLASGMKTELQQGADTLLQLPSPPAPPPKWWGKERREKPLSKTPIPPGTEFCSCSWQTGASASGNLKLKQASAIRAVLLIWLISISTNTIAEQIRLEVEMRPPVLSRKEIIDIAGISGDGKIEEAKLFIVRNKILEKLRSVGYPLAEVDSVSYSQNIETDKNVRPPRNLDEVRKCILFVNPGPALSVIATEGSERLLTPDWIEEQAAEVLDSLTAAGYPFASVSFKPVHPLVADGNLRVRLDRVVHPGSFLRIGRVRFPGGEGLGGKYLLLESRLKLETAFSKEELTRSVQRLELLPSIMNVSEPELREISPGILDVTIPVATKSSTRVSGIAALASGAKEPTGQFKIDIGNLFGGGRSASFAWYGLNPNQRGLQGRYREGWLFDLPLALEAELEGWQTKDSHNRTTYRIGGSWEPFTDVTLGVSGASAKVVNLNELNLLPESSTRRLESNIEIARFDSRWNPSRGYSFGVENVEGRRSYSDNSPSTSIRSGRTKIEMAFPLALGNSRKVLSTGIAKRASANRWIGYLRAENSFATGKNLLADELPKFGGHSSVRGFLEDSFSGRNVVFGAAEIRYRPNREAGYIGLTIDAGSIVKADYLTSPAGRNAWSVGVTTVFQTGLGIMSLDLAWPAGGTFAESRLHLGLSGWL